MERVWTPFPFYDRFLFFFFFFPYISFYSHALALDFLTLTVFEYLLIPSLIRERNGRWRACLDVQEEQLRGEKNFTLHTGGMARYDNNIFHDFFFFFSF